MSTYFVEETAIIDAPSAQVYGIISDYHEGHQAILPSRYFDEMKVTAGGQGAGTEVAVSMSVFGSKALYNLKVSEPEPGRILLEEDKEAGVVTTFTVDPLTGGSRSRVTIATTAKTSPGLKGMLERLVTSAITRRIYREELAKLAAYVREEKTAA